MNPYLQVRVWKQKIKFFNLDDENIDLNTINSFGNEWLSFSKFTKEDIDFIAKDYFDIINEEDIKDKIVLDAGCGSGRWSKYIADKVKHIELVDPSMSVFVVAELLKDKKNITINHASINQLPFDDEYFDFIMSLGVIHHIPNIEDALQNLTKKLKKNGKILLFIYYNLDNRGNVYKALFLLSDILRRLISSLPFFLKKLICETIAFIVYLPFVKIAKFLDYVDLKKLSKKIPLEYYKDKSYMIIRNDALDRFGTPLEQRFSKKQIYELLIKNNFKEIIFSKKKPFYHLVATKK